MENDGDFPPTFWFQPPIATRRRPPSPFLNPVILIIIIPILALILIFFFLLPFLNHTSNLLNLKPNSVKKSWDSLNIFLVLFAILCGVLSRKNDDVTTPAVDDGGGGDQVNRFPNTSWSQWDEQFIERDRKVYGDSVRETVTDNSRLRRNSSSYPDLRQELAWDTRDNLNLATPAYVQRPARRSEKVRENVVHHSPPLMRRSKAERGNVLHRSQSAESVYLQDALRLSEMERESVLYRSPPRNEVERGNILNRSQSAVSDHFDNRPRRSEVKREFSVEKEIPVDTFQIHGHPQHFSPLQSPAPPPPPPAPTASFKPRRSYQSVKRKEKVKFESENEAEKEKLWPPPTPPPPPPPPPPSFTCRSQQKHKKLERQISDATKEIATAITSLYNQTKKKKKRRTRNIYDHANVSPSSASSSPEQAVAPSPALPPPPPPLPPPPFVFHNIFKKGSKQKRIHSVPATTSLPSQSQLPPPPPPPPPPPSSIFNNLFKGAGKSKRFNSSIAPPPPPSSILNSIFNSGSKSKRHSPAVYPPQPPAPPSPPLSPPTITKSQSADSFQAYYNYHLISPRLSRRKTLTPPPPTMSNSESLRRRPSSKGKPPLPTKSNNYYERDEYHEYINSGSQSPLNPIPPPLPPFTMPEMKFKIRGDFVRIGSGQSSVSNSPDRDTVDFSSMQKSLEESDGGDVIGPVFFPSPDVNTKADNFISRLKDEWKMEKVNSIKGKQKLGLLGLGPGLSPQ